MTKTDSNTPAQPPLGNDWPETAQLKSLNLEFSDGSGLNLPFHSPLDFKDLIDVVLTPAQPMPHDRNLQPNTVYEYRQGIATKNGYRQVKIQVRYKIEEPHNDQQSISGFTLDEIDRE